jgi:hypothetical protein
VLGEADLNLCDYAEGEFNYMQLSLKGCSDSSAFIEVGLKATQIRDKKLNGSIIGNTSHHGRDTPSR